MDHFFFIILLPVVVALNATKPGKEIKSKTALYLRDLIFRIVILLAIYFAEPMIYKRLDFDKIGRGLIINDMLSVILPLFLTPFILSFTKWKPDYSKSILTKKELFGLPISMFPNSFGERLLFTAYIVVGVIFEEFFCRQFMFFSFNEILHLTGDLLLVTTSVFFALGHFYQRWKGMAISFILGLILGKVFQMEGSIVYPIVLHLLINLQVLIMAFKRSWGLTKNEQG